MLGANDAERPSDDPGPELPGRSRRSLLKGAAAAGAAGIAAVALADGGPSSRSAAGPARGGTTPARGSDPVVVHVRDAATGEMDVFRGTTCTRVRDTELAARLIRASN